MAQVPQKTLSWLWDVLRREYHDPNRTYSDLAQTLSKFPGFAPRTDVYTFENGAPALLVHILGNLPVSFRGTTYRFPVELWIPHAYPHDSPIVYVKPSGDMIVRPGQHVGGDGRVYHHYLAHWREAWDRSNVVEFLSMLADIFSREPPVAAKQQQPQRIQQQPQPQPPPRPPPPNDIQRPPRRPPYQQDSNAPPPPPPKPSSQDTSRSGGDPSPRLSRYDAPPPLPHETQASGRPPSMAQPRPQSNGNASQPYMQPQYIPQRLQSLRQDQSPSQRQQQPQLPPQQYQQPFPPNNASQSQPLQQPPPQSYPQQPPPPFQQQQRPPSQQYHNQQPNQTPQPQKKPAPDLLDSPFDLALPVQPTNIPAPPIPRNPEKDALLSHLSSTLTSTLHHQISQNTSALAPLQSQHQALQSTLYSLQSEIQNLSNLQSSLTSNVSLLQQSLSSADSAIANAKKRSAAGDIPKVDAMLIPPHVAGRQLYDTVCDEKGIEAAIFCLQEAFVRGRVGSEVWSRKTRELAREGFRRRWLEQKVGMGMGLEV